MSFLKPGQFGFLIKKLIPSAKLKPDDTNRLKID